MQKIIEGLLVVVDQWVQFMRKGEYHMKIRGIDHLSPTFVHPDFLVDGLAVVTAAVSAGVIMEFQMAAFRTLGNILFTPGFSVLQLSMALEAFFCPSDRKQKLSENFFMKK